MRILQLLFLFISLFAIVGCDQFHYSPYATSGEKPHLITSELGRLSSIESSVSFPFKVAFISDTHNDYAGFRDVVDYINSHSSEYAFVIHCGDLTTFATEREYMMAKNLLKDLLVPFFVVPGNHDLIANGPTLYKNYFGPKDYTFAFKDVRFVLFSDNNWEDPGAPRLSWLESVTSSATEGLKILVTHIPPSDLGRFDEATVEKFKDISLNGNVDYIASGHIHSDGEFKDFTPSTRNLDAGLTTHISKFKVLTFDGAAISESTVSF